MKNRTKWLVGTLIAILLIGGGVVLANPELYKGRLTFRAAPTVQRAVPTVQQPVSPTDVKIDLKHEIETVSLHEMSLRELDRLPAFMEIEGMQFMPTDLAGRGIDMGPLGDDFSTFTDGVLGERDRGPERFRAAFFGENETFVISFDGQGKVMSGGSSETDEAVAEEQRIAEQMREKGYIVLDPIVITPDDEDPTEEAGRPWDEHYDMDKEHPLAPLIVSTPFKNEFEKWFGEQEEGSVSMIGEFLCPLTGRVYDEKIIVKDLVGTMRALEEQLVDPARGFGR